MIAVSCLVAELIKTHPQVVPISGYTNLAYGEVINTMLPPKNTTTWALRGGDGSVEVLRDSVYVDACHHWVPGADS